MAQELETITSDIQRVMGEVVPEPEDSEAIQLKIVEQIARADSLEALFADHSSIGTKDIVGKPILISDCRLVESTITDSRGVYMLIEAADLTTGEVMLLNSGSPKIMMVIYQLKKRGMLPVECAVREVAPARPGRNAPLGLDPIGKTLDAIEKARKKG